MAISVAVLRGGFGKIFVNLRWLGALPIIFILFKTNLKSIFFIGDFRTTGNINGGFLFYLKQT